MNYKIVEITWLDHSSHSISQWRELPEVKELKPVLCYSIGYVLHETDEYITLGQTIAPNEELEDNYCGDMLILKNCIKKSRVIELSMENE